MEGGLRYKKCSAPAKVPVETSEYNHEARDLPREFFQVVAKER